jgi:hypothetical protein
LGSSSQVPGAIPRHGSSYQMGGLLMSLRALHRSLVAAAILTVALGLTASAFAQGVYYREIEKDGRIYVFSSGQRADLFEKSGEIGTAITRVGAGPNGETLVFENEDAINLYNFKHGLPGEYFPKPAEPAKPADPTSIKLGATIFSDFTYQDAPKVTDADRNSVNASSFEVRRAYINVTGHVTREISFRITPDVGSRAASSGTVTTNAVDKDGNPATATAGASNNYDGSLLIRLKYAFAQYSLDDVVSKGTWIRFGQQQTPWIDFMEGIYRYRFQGTIFTDREGYLSSSDLGLSARVALPSDYGDIHVGFYNGDTYSKSEANDQKALQVRATVRPLPKLEPAKGLRLSVFYDLDHPVKSADRKRLVAAVTFEHKYVNAGFEYLDARDNASATKPVVSSSGFSVWATPRTTFGLEGLFRYDRLKPNKDIAARKTRLLAGAAYWFRMPKPGLSTAVLGDFEQVKYDSALGKPTEKRFELKTLFNF